MSGYPLFQVANAAVVFVDEADPEFRNKISEYFENMLELVEGFQIPWIRLEYMKDKIVLDETLRGEIAGLKKHVIVICGGYLEGAITQITLSGLLDGYDVFVVADLCHCLDQKHQMMFFDRLRSCGAHVVTCKQLIYEAIAQNTEKEAAPRLRALLAS